MSEPKIVQDLKLMPSRIKLAEHERRDFVVTVEKGVTVADLARPDFWSLVSPKFHPYDRIEIRSDEGDYWAEAIVLGCDRAWAKLHILREAKLTTPDVAMSQAEFPYEVAFKGAHRKWCVIRKSDKELLREGDSMRETAETWAKDHHKATA